MAIYKRGSVWWADIKVAGKPRHREPLGTMDRLEALEKEQALRLKLANGHSKRDPHVQAPTLKAAFERFVERYEGESKRVVWSHAMNIMEALGEDCVLSDIDEPVISKMIDRFKKEGNSGATINRKTSTLGTMLKTACYEWRVIHRVPYIKRFKESQGRIRVVTHEEEAKLRELFKDFHESLTADLVTFLVDTGCRLGEALKLKCQDVNFNQHCLYVWKPKNKTPRVVPMTDRVTALLKEMCKGKPVDYQLFGRLDPQHLTYTWRKAREAMNISDPEFTIHALRHTTATRLINAGADIYTVQHYLGHSSVKVTERYAHLNGESLQGAAKLLGERLSHVPIDNPPPNKDHI